VDRADFWVYVATFVLTIGLGIENGIMLGAAIALARVIQNAAQPHSAVLGRMGDTQVYRNIRRWETARPVPGLAILRFDAGIFFANADAFKARVLQLATPAPGQPVSTIPRAILVDCSAVGSIDSSAIHMLDALGEDVQKHVATLYEERLGMIEKHLKLAKAGKLSDSPYAAVDEEAGVNTLEGALAAVLELERAHKPSSPTLHFTSMRGPVRDRMLKSKAVSEHHAAELERKRAGRCGWCVQGGGMHKSALDGDIVASDGKPMHDVLMHQDVHTAVQEITAQWERASAAASDAETEEEADSGEAAEVGTTGAEKVDVDVA
jgi:MFS superfamily sulfate permease-like transporter